MSYEDAGFILSVAMFAQLPATLSAHVLEKAMEAGPPHRDGHGVAAFPAGASCIFRWTGPSGWLFCSAWRREPYSAAEWR